MYKKYTNKRGVPKGYVRQILLIMRLTTIILIVAIMQVSASTFAQRITLSEKNATLSRIFDRISDQCGYDFVFNSDLLKGTKPVTINVKNTELDKVLEQIFAGQPLSFSVEDKTVVVKAKQKGFFENMLDNIRAIDVRGKVLDENGSALAGAFVRTESDAVIFVTGKDGVFSFRNLSENTRLIVSYVGYQTDTVKIRGAAELVITLKPKVYTLSETNILSTGYQKLTREQATGAFSKPDMQQFNSRVATNDLVRRLEGLVAGLTVVPGEGGKGANRYATGTTQQSILRGKSSVGLQSEPLYVLDGVQVPNLSYINPNDVGDITVLKDAAAAAIYGAKAANGVIVVNTKTGAKNQKVSISYNSSFNFDGKPRFKDDYYMNSAQFIQTAKELFDPISYPYADLSRAFVAPHEKILYDLAAGQVSQTEATKSLDSLSGLNNRQQMNDLLFQDAFSLNNSVSVSGGSRLYSVYSSLFHTKSQTTAPGQSSNNFQVNVNQSVQPTNWLTIGLNTRLDNLISKSKTPVSVGEGFLPYQLFADENGDPLTMNYLNGWAPDLQANFQARSKINLDYMPLEEKNKGYEKSNLLNVNTSASVSVRFWKGLSFQGNYGYQRSAGTTNGYVDHTAIGMRKELLNFTIAATPASVPVYYLPATGGKYTTLNNTSENWTVRNQLVLNTGLRGGKDRLNVQLGQEVLENFSMRNTSILRGYDDVLKTYALMDYVTLAKPLFGGVGSGYSVFSEKPFDRLAERTRFLSYFGLFSYALNEKYLINASVRGDKSSLFGTDIPIQDKPSFSIGGRWELSKEKWMGQLNWLDNLSLRATYGVTGNSPYIGAASIFDVLSAGRDNILGNYLSLSAKANNKLSWEATHTWNFGLDFGLLKNRLSGSTELYFKNTTDLLGQVELNPFSGAKTTGGNIGNIKNSGIELTLNSNNVMRRNFSWTTSLVFSYNHNKLVSYSKPGAQFSDVYAQINATYKIGYAIPSMFAFRYAGLDNMGDPQIYTADGSVTKDPYAAKPEDLVYMGTTQPKFNGGLNNTFRYKEFSVSANLIYNLGAVMRNNVVAGLTDRLSVTSLTDGNLQAAFDNRWKVPGNENQTNVPGYISDPAESGRRNLGYYSLADINVMSASYIKLRDVTFRYNLAPRLLQRLKIEQLSVSAQTGNFLVWSANDQHIDPEFSGSQLSNRSFSLGLNITF